jgi:hypothetical protein
VVSTWMWRAFASSSPRQSPTLAIRRQAFYRSTCAKPSSRPGLTHQVSCLIRSSLAILCLLITREWLLSRSRALGRLGALPVAPPAPGVRRGAALPRTPLRSAPARPTDEGSSEGFSSSGSSPSPRAVPGRRSGRRRGVAAVPSEGVSPSPAPAARATRRRLFAGTSSAPALPRGPGADAVSSASGSGDPSSSASSWGGLDSPSEGAGGPVAGRPATRRPAPSSPGGAASPAAKRVRTNKRRSARRAAVRAPVPEGSP